MLKDAGQLCGYKHRRLYDIASVLCSLNLVPQHIILFYSFHSIICLFQIRKMGLGTFKWIYDPTITNHRFCNTGPEALAVTMTPEKSFRPNPQSEKTSDDDEPDTKRPREQSSGHCFQKHQQGNH